MEEEIRLPLQMMTDVSDTFWLKTGKLLRAVYRSQQQQQQKLTNQLCLIFDWIRKLDDQTKNQRCANLVPDFCLPFRTIETVFRLTQVLSCHPVSTASEAPNSCREIPKWNRAPKRLVTLYRAQLNPVFWCRKWQVPRVHSAPRCRRQRRTQSPSGLVIIACVIASVRRQVLLAVPRGVFTAVQGLARGCNARVVATALPAATGVVGMVSGTSFDNSTTLFQALGLPHLL